MRLLISITTETNAEPNMQVIKTGGEPFGVVITAPTLQDALQIIPTEKDLASAPDFVPIGDTSDPAPAADGPRYRISTISEEALDRTIAEYEATPAGKMLPRKLEQARILRKKTGHRVSGPEFGYMAAQAHKDACSAMYDYYDLAFKRGYDAAKREQKKKGKPSC